MNTSKKIGRLGQIPLGVASVIVAGLALGACTPTPGAPAGATHPVRSAPTVHPTPAYNAPTANLTKLANAITDHEKSLSTEIDAPGSLGLTSSVSIGVAYSTNDVDFTTGPVQSYSNGAGNQFHYDFPGNTYPTFTTFGVDMRVTLNDKISATNTKTFTFTLVRTIHPLYDVTISPLTVKLLSSPTRSGYGWVQWRDPSRVAAQTNLSVSESRGYSTQTVFQFARQYHAIDLATYQLPTASYFYAGVTDTRPYPTADVAAPQNNQPLLSGPTGISTITYTLHNPRYDTSTDYALNLSFSVTRHPVLYGHLV
jgi:hypothetical protein